VPTRPRPALSDGTAVAARAPTSLEEATMRGDLKALGLGAAFSMFCVNGCVGASTEEATGAVTGETGTVDLTGCTAVPANFAAGGLVRRYHDFPGSVVIAPGRPHADQEAFVLLESILPRYYGDQSARIIYTSDGWNSKTPIDLQDYCPERMWPVFGTSLGAHPDGTRIELAVFHHIGGDHPKDTWLNNQTANYPVIYENPDPVSWVGGTRITVGGRPVSNDLVMVGQPMDVYTETYPMGSARSVELHWTAADGTEASTAMTFDRDDAGSYGHNSQWKATIPANAFAVGQATAYSVVATGYAGGTVDEEGERHTVTPRTFEIDWAGGFGQFRPSSHEYTEGRLFQADGSTNMGCWNHGVSGSSYVERAVRVWIPGLTDRHYDSEEARAAIGALIRVQTVTDIPGTLGTIEGRYAAQAGNDFIFTFMPFTTFCVTHDSAPADGTYGFKVRFSTDGGKTWFWRGTQVGGEGGENVPLHFRYGCSYFGDASDCIDLH
jgi:hypothetical protein